jgi:hypothetical protein
VRLQIRNNIKGFLCAKRPVTMGGHPMVTLYEKNAKYSPIAKNDPIVPAIMLATIRICFPR